MIKTKQRELGLQYSIYTLKKKDYKETIEALNQCYPCDVSFCDVTDIENGKHQANGISVEQKGMKNTESELMPYVEDYLKDHDEIKISCFCGEGRVFSRLLPDFIPVELTGKDRKSLMKYTGYVGLIMDCIYDGKEYVVPHFDDPIKSDDLLKILTLANEVAHMVPYEVANEYNNIETKFTKMKINRAYYTPSSGQVVFSFYRRYPHSQSIAIINTYGVCQCTPLEFSLESGFKGAGGNHDFPFEYQTDFVDWSLGGTKGPVLKYRK